MSACGGPLEIAGYESPLVCVSEFQSSCVQLLETLNMELGDDPVDINDPEIGVDDLRVVSDGELLERALEESKNHEKQVARTVTRKKKEKKSKLSKNTTPIQAPKRGRPYDYIARKTYLQTNTMALEKVIRERKLSREKAAVTLHSLRVKQEKMNMRLRSAGPLKFVTSTLEAPKTQTSLTHHQAISPFEVMISVDFHSTTNTKIQEFTVLGGQPLTALRDQLYCVMDELALKKNMIVPSGYFLIEDAFYNDMRHPEAVDYSKPIISWIAKQDQTRKTKSLGRKLSKLPIFKTALMEYTYFHDLKFKLGSKYLYCHQGDCKHVMVFRDIRLGHVDDAQDSAAYPLLRFLPRLRRRKCNICMVFRAKKVTYDDKLAPSSPCFFCESCYYSLHYREGVPLYQDFTVEDYQHE